MIVSELGNFGALYFTHLLLVMINSLLLLSFAIENIKTIQQNSTVNEYQNRNKDLDTPVATKVITNLGSVSTVSGPIHNFLNDIQL